MPTKVAVPTGASDREKALLRTMERAINTAGPPKLPSFTVALLPDAAALVQCQIYVSNESGGAVPAFSDGTNWRRVTDRAIIS